MRDTTSRPKALGMFKRFLKPHRLPPATPPGLVVYAIGDVHGRSDLLRILLGRILSEAQGLAASSQLRPVIVGLGDYIDRGPDSRGVLDLLIELGAVKGLECHFLCGNHDQTALDFIDDPASGPTWCEFGGREALASYGVRAPASRSDSQAWVQARDAFASALPASHLGFLKALKSHLEIGDYFFAHAGARPGVALQDQSERDLMWIREPFLSDPRPFEKVVVHGHSAGELIHADHRRINVDTGAYATHQLTSARLEGTRQSFLYTRRDGAGFSVVEAQA